MGSSCNPDALPSQPALGISQILNAFRLTPFAKPGVHIQPEGNVTLVTLPTYFAVEWPTDGYQPGEVDTAEPAQMLGHTVRIRPTAQGYTYVYGDGTSFGPTHSPGGTYPDGDIRKTYDKAGTYDTHIQITYGGEFSVDGGQWIQIPDTVQISGPVQPIQVKTAKNRLYTH